MNDCNFNPLLQLKATTLFLPLEIVAPSISKNSIHFRVNLEQLCAFLSAETVENSSASGPYYACFPDTRNASAC